MSRPLAPSARPLLATPRTLDRGMLRVLRARLELQRDFRIDQLAALQTIAPHPAGSAPDEIVEAEIVEALCRGAANALRETREALWRLDEGCFGRCVECTQPLEPEQLAAVPQAARCPACEFVRR